MRAERPDLATVDDPQRLATLRASNLLDSPRSEDFDRITRMAADAVGVPVVLVTLVDAERQFFLSSVGLGPAFEERRETPLSVSLCQYVVAGDDALVIEDTRAVRWLRDKAAVEDFGVLAYAGFPLHAGNGHPIGSFSAIDTSPREWSQRELDLMRDFAAIVQAELDLRAARDDARRSSALLARLQSLTDATGSAGELDALLEDVVSACVEGFSADLAVIDLVDGNGRLLRRAARGLAAERPRDALRFGDGFAGRVGTLEQTVSVYDLQAFESADGLRAAGARSLLAVAADRFAAAIARVGEHERNRLVAQTLVSALQPARLPSVKGVRLAARYLPAERGLGGDWYDVFRLPGGALGLAIGDVVGHGIEAAAEAVRLRNALRGAVLEGHAPPDAVAALNRHASLHPGAYASTVVYLELDAATRRLRWSSAGHLPGVVASRGRGEWLGIADGPPLGVSDADAWPGAERVLEPGSRVVLFTDGLIERRAEPLDAGIDRVAAVAASAPDVERLCETTLVQAPAPRVDDLALIALELD